MWEVTPRGDFLSAVAATEDKYFNLERYGEYLSESIVCVRARVGDDLKALCEFAKQRDGVEPKPIYSANSDYAYRVLIDVNVWAEFNYQASFAVLEYSNFKSHVSAKRGNQRSSVLHSAWSAFMRLEQLDPRVKAANAKRAAETAKRSQQWRAMRPAAGSTAGGYPWTRSGVSEGLTAALETLDVDDDLYAREHGAGAWWSDEEAGAAAAAEELEEQDKLIDEIHALEREGQGRGRAAKRARRRAFLKRRQLDRAGH